MFGSDSINTAVLAFYVRELSQQQLCSVKTKVSLRTVENCKDEDATTSATTKTIATSIVPFKDDVEVVDVMDLKTAGTQEFDDETKNACAMFKS